MLDGDVNGSRFVIEYRHRGRGTGAALANSPAHHAPMHAEVPRGLDAATSLAGCHPLAKSAYIS